MSLPIVTTSSDERWDCHQCGICCRGSLVPLSGEDLARLRSQKWEQHADYRGVPIVKRTSWLRAKYRLAHRADGSCVFSNDQGLCRIHAELGYEAKPTICRVFPLQLVPHEKQTVLTMRRACPSSSVDRGQPLQGHLPMVRQFVQQGRLRSEPAAPPLLKSGERRDWKATRGVLSAIARQLNDERFPPVRRLVHALQFTQLLQKARTKSLDADELAELVGVLEQAAPEQAQGYFQQRPAPSAAAGVLFRLAAVEFQRLHPAYRTRPSWVQRGRLAGIAWKMTRGRGQLPQLHSDFPAATFEQLEQPLGRVDLQVYAPLARLIETSGTSWLYALANRKGWSIIDSVRALALCYPIGLWMLRWASAGRQPTQQDMISIVVALDRGQGYASLSGAQHRWRVRTLARLGALERLIAWYAR